MSLYTRAPVETPLEAVVAAAGFFQADVNLVPPVVRSLIETGHVNADEACMLTGARLLAWWRAQIDNALE